MSLHMFKGQIPRNQFDILHVEGRIELCKLSFFLAFLAQVGFDRWEGERERGVAVVGHAVARTRNKQTSELAADASNKIGRAK